MLMYRFNNVLYCDIVKIYLFILILMFLKQTLLSIGWQKGMIGVLVIVEARNPFQKELYTENIDKYSNVCMNCSGILDIWEGTLSWI